MAGLDFFVDVVVSGAVLGVGLTDNPDSVARVLGAAFVDECQATRLRRDYGLVEFFWDRHSQAGPWSSRGFTVHAHRLAAANVIGDLAIRYGRFGARLPFARLNDELERLGCLLEEITNDSDRPEYRRYWQAEAEVAVVVAANEWDGRLAAGDVWSILAPWRRDHFMPADAGRRQAVKDGLTHLLRLGDAERTGWLDRRQPSPADDPDWWLHLLLVIDGQLDTGGQPDWLALKLWLLHQARARGVFTPAESAERIAYFVANARRSAPVDGTLLPPADEVVRACLDAIPVGIDQVAQVDDRRNLRRLNRAQLHHSRQARNLISAAEPHLDQVEDPILVQELRRWLSIRSRLV